MAGKPVLILSARHRPIEITVLVAFFLVGTIGLFQPARTVQQLNDALHGWGWLWYAGIALGSSTALLSMIPKIPTSLIWERIGLTIISTFLVGYTFASTMFFGIEGLRASLIVVLFGLGCLLRAYQITRNLRLLEEAVSRSNKEGDK
jgi:predicted benzoate:H+ symporter BenE